MSKPHTHSTIKPCYHKVLFSSKCSKQTPHGSHTRVRWKGPFMSSQFEFNIPSNHWYKVHQIPKLQCLSSRLSVVFAQSIEARCYVENEDVVGAAPTGIRGFMVIKLYTILAYISQCYNIIWLYMENFKNDLNNKHSHSSHVIYI